MPTANRSPRSSLPDVGAQLDRLELEIYLGLDGIEPAAEAIVAAARGDGDVALGARAELLRSDVLSRSGRLGEALALQRAVANAARERRDAGIEARAGCQLASTYARLGLMSESQLAAEAGVRHLNGDCPAHWHAEHMMVLALFTSYDRAGTVDYELFEEALRLARRHGDPTLVVAVLNNYAYTAVQGDAHLPRAMALVDEMAALIDAGGTPASLATVDTVAWARLAAGRIDEAGELLEAALATAARVEPDDYAGVLAHLAAVRRRQARPAEAAGLLERARALALKTETPEVAVAALRDLAELDAERGDYRRAYRRLVRFLDEQDAAERIDSERRAAILQSVYGTQLERDRRRHYERLATRDALTGLYNRRHVEEQLPGLLASMPVAVAMIDVDHFKQINDGCSHAVGDLVLKELGVLLEQHAGLSEGGFGARLGGEEFLLVMPRQTPAEALDSLEELRLLVQGHAWPEVPEVVTPTISAGLVVADAHTRSLPEVLAEADRRLYAAKRAGRNRTHCPDV